MSLRTSRSGAVRCAWPAISSSCARMRRISRAWISMSLAWPPPSVYGWWIRMRALRQREPLARRARGEQHGRGRGGLAQADGLDLRPDELHRVVDRRQRGERAARRVDVDGDVAVGVDRLQRQQLRHHVVGRRVVDLHAEEDDALLEQLGVRVHLLHAVRRCARRRRASTYRLFDVSRSASPRRRRLARAPASRCARRGRRSRSPWPPRR